MSNITLDIAGRKFTVACGPGEEAHIEKLGRIIDSKIEGMPGLGNQSEARCLLYAALLLADEIDELRSAGPPPAQGEDSRSAETLERLAETLESLAERLENAA